MDIADILASVTQAHDSVQQGVQDGAERRQDFQMLTRTWISERVAPELLPYPAALMDRVMKRLRAEIEYIEESTARMDAGTSFTLVVLQTELERFKFVIRSYLRTRISKIDAHPTHIISLHGLAKEAFPLVPLLSQTEAQYAETHSALLNRHYSASFLSAFPPKLQRLDDKAGAGGVSMVDGPDLDMAVIVRCLGQRHFDATQANAGRQASFATGPVFNAIEVLCGYADVQSARVASRNDSSEPGVRLERPEQRIRMERGDVWMTRWSNVKELILSSECELL